MALYSGRHRNNLDDDSDIRELERAEGRIKDDVKTEGEDGAVETALPAPTTPEEATYSKRYADLRRHAAEKDKRIKELERQLEQVSQGEVDLPATPEELSTWMQQYPDLGRIFRTLVAQEADKRVQHMEERFKALDEREKQNKIAEAERKLAEKHPDFAILRNSDDFHNWAQEQWANENLEWIQKALYDEETLDYKAVSRALDLYKLDRGVTPIKTRKPAPSPADAVPTRTRVGPSDTAGEKRKFKESEIRTMNPRMYERMEEEIDAARREGRIIYDLSGASM